MHIYTKIHKQYLNVHKFGQPSGSLDVTTNLFSRLFLHMYFNTLKMFRGIFGMFFHLT